MEILPVLRLIWRCRLRLAAGVLGAVTIFVALGGTKAVTSTSAVAWTNVTLDTPKSQLVEAAPFGAGTLAWRASLLSHLMATRTSTEQLAHRLGVNTDQVTVVDPVLALPSIPTDMATAAAKAAASGTSARYALTVFLADYSLPVISIEAAAPDRTGAERLAEAAVAVLQSQASPDKPFTSPVVTDAGTLRLQAFVVGQVAPVRVKLVRSTSLPVKAIGASVVVLVLWCAGAVLMPGLSRRHRPHGRALPA